MVKRMVIIMIKGYGYFLELHNRQMKNVQIFKGAVYHLRGFVVRLDSRLHCRPRVLNSFCYLTGEHVSRTIEIISNLIQQICHYHFIGWLINVDWYTFLSWILAFWFIDDKKQFLAELSEFPKIKNSNHSIKVFIILHFNMTIINSVLLGHA